MLVRGLTHVNSCGQAGHRPPGCVPSTLRPAWGVRARGRMACQAYSCMGSYAWRQAELKTGTAMSEQVQVDFNHCLLQVSSS